MKTIRVACLRLKGLIGSRRLDRDFASELDAHLQLHIDDNVRAGMTPEAARRDALMKLGGIEQVRDQHRDRRGIPAVDTLLQDVRYGLRVLRKSPAFTAVAVGVLACGIGVNTAVFTLINTMLLRPLEGHRSSDLVTLYSQDTEHPDQYRAFSYPDYRDIREDKALFNDVAAHRVTFIGLTEDKNTRRVMADFVSANYFDVFGVRLSRGRTFTTGEEAPGSSAPAAIVSYAYWRRTGFDPDLLGKTLRVNAHDVSIVGIAPENFTGTIAVVGPELWLPLGLWDATAATAADRQPHLDARNNYTLQPFGHLRTGLTVATAAASLQNLARRLQAAYPGPGRNQALIAEPMPRLRDGPVPGPETELTTFAAVMMGLAAIVLLIACLNISNLLMARGVARRHEIAVRLALGAARPRIVRQLLVEDLLLALLGGAAGLLLSFWSLTLLMSSIGPVEGLLVLSVHVRPDIRVLLATMTFCSLSTLLFGLGPALRSSRGDVLPELKNHTGEEGHQRLFTGRNLLVIGQLALSMALVTFGGLFVRAAWRAADATPGYSLDGQLVASVDMGMAGYDEARGKALYRDLQARVRSLPYVESAGLASQVAFSDFTENHPITRDDSSTPLSAIYTVVGPDYFTTLRLPLLRGRDFTRIEQGGGRPPRVAIVDDALATRLWPKAEAVGQHVRLQTFSVAAGALLATKDWTSLEVVGVVPGLRHELTDSEPVPHVYVPLAEQYQSAMHLQVRVSPGAEAVTLSAIGDVIRRLDDRLPVLGLGTFQQQRNESVNLWLIKSGGRLFTIFGLVALGVAVIGVYGVKSYVVARRTREIAIRIALGATPRDVLLLVLKQGLMLTGAGLAIGLLLSAALARGLSSWLLDARAFDPAVFGLAALTLAATALLASYIPCRRVMKIAPLMALRRE